MCESNMKKFAILCLVCLAITAQAFGATKSNTGNKAELYYNSLNQGKIVYIPHDNRPVSDELSADTVKMVGIDVVVPPDELLGNRENLGEPDKLWEWLEKTVTVYRKPTKEEKRRLKLKSKDLVKDLNPEVKAIVISGDSMIYGSLVGSRKHSLTSKKLEERAAMFGQFKKKYPGARLYVFSSIMRTPSSGEHSGTEDPEYYQRYGVDIFRYTVLNDMAEEKRLSAREEKERAFLEELIPKEYTLDWFGRREKNFNVNKQLLELARDNTFECFALGRDDNAAWSQTHMESRHLKDFIKKLGTERVHNLSGIDEVGMLMLTRAVNDLKHQQPVISADYNWGNGRNTIPTYSDEPIDTTVREHVALLGGKYSERPEGSDLLLLVNTNPNGETLAANLYENTIKLRSGVRYFVDMVEEALNNRYTVGIADVSFVNGSDNALMAELERRQLFYKVQSYSGWNTPTNSVGFALAQGVLAKSMREDDKNKLLLLRYLDDWAYQANVRQTVARQLSWFEGAGLYSKLGDNKQDIERRATGLLQLFAENHLPPSDFIKRLKVTSPWSRLFEARIQFEK